MNTRRLLAVALVVAGFVQAEPFRAERLADMDGAIEAAIRAGQCPGGVLWLEQGDQRYHRAYGNRAVEPERELMAEDTVFDAASLTKVVATTAAVMVLIERGQLALDAPAARYWPEFGRHGKEVITVRHLLTHCSGLRAGLPDGPTGREAVLDQACEEKPTGTPGTRFRYSDINFIVLGELVQRVSGRPFETFCLEAVFRPLGMRDTAFMPATSAVSRIAPTERNVPRGVVHDPTARRMGGVAGHAGLFTTASDLARFARMLVRGGELDGVRLLQSETVRLMTTPQSPDAVWELRGLGWDIDSPYAGPRGARFSSRSYGHTGWTGGSLWIDPWAQAFVIFLSNRNHPTEAGNVIGLRRTLGTLAAEALSDPPE